MSDSWLYDAELSHRVAAYLDVYRPRLADGSVDLRAALRFLHAEGAPALAARAADAASIARVIATVAFHDLSVAFSLWSHRMTLSYLDAADPRAEDAPRGELERLAVIGCSALAAGLAHHVLGAPLTITARRSGGGLVLDGSIRWASNLFAPEFVLVTAVEVPGERPVVVRVPGDRKGLEVDPFPRLLELQATRSASVRLRGVEVRADEVLTDAFDAFVGRIRPRFLLLQSSFCWGLSARSLRESEHAVRGGVAEVFADEHRALTAELRRIESALEALTRAPPAAIRPWVLLRLEAARLAGEATRLESTVAGGASYVVGSAAARRRLEAAFLPVQSPTEGQLLWEVRRSA
ncbi:MAG TPA: hypothetical protein VHC69_29780 [Polyangiaceae bacterium]|nr:hypothetical protein [Polyangiaceae bacterium]